TQGGFLPELEVLEEGHVEIKIAWTAELVPCLVRPGGVSRPGRSVDIGECTGIDATRGSWIAVSVGSTAGGLSPPGNLVAHNVASTVVDGAGQGAVQNRERKPGMRENLSGPLPPTQQFLHDLILEVNRWADDEVDGDEVTYVIVGVSVVTRTQAGGIVLSQKRVRVKDEETAIGYFIQGVGERIVEVRKDPVTELLPQGDSNTVVVGHGATLIRIHFTVIGHNGRLTDARDSYVEAVGVVGIGP